jgi:hypothetical protein
MSGLLLVSEILLAATIGTPRYSYQALKTFWQQVIIGSNKQAILDYQHLFSKKKSAIPPELQARLAEREMALAFYLARGNAYQPPRLNGDSGAKHKARQADERKHLDQYLQQVRLEQLFILLHHYRLSSEVKQCKAKRDIIIKNNQLGLSLNKITKDQPTHLKNLSMLFRQLKISPSFTKLLAVKSDQVKPCMTVTLADKANQRAEIEKLVNQKILVALENKIGKLLKDIKESQEPLETLLEDLEVETRTRELLALEEDLQNLRSNLLLVHDDSLLITGCDAKNPETSISVGQCVELINKINFKAKIEQLKNGKQLPDIVEALKEKTGLLITNSQVILTDLSNLTSYAPSQLTSCKNLDINFSALVVNPDTIGQGHQNDQFYLQFQDCLLQITAYLQNAKKTDPFEQAGLQFATHLKPLATAIHNILTQEVK